MMQREHFHKCPCVPQEMKDRLETLKSINMQGACDSREYWTNAAKKIGMVDTPRGIEVTPEAIAKGKTMPPFGTGGPEPNVAIQEEPPILLVEPSDKARTNPFLYTLLAQLQVVRLTSPEKTGKRRSLDVGLKGIGCRYCCKAGRNGFSRTYPLRKKTLLIKLNDMFYHLQRCTVCPTEVKADLRRYCNDQQQCKEKNGALFERIWKQLGRDGDITF